MAEADPSRPRWRRALPWLALAAVYTAVSLVYFWPLPRLWGDHIGPDLGDPLFDLYVLKWGVHQIRLGLPDVWDANIFYPTRGALAFSDHLLGPAAQLALFLTVIPNAIAGFNFLFVSSFVASALTTAWVLRRSGLSWTASVLGGWMYAFSSFRLSQMSHLQVLIAQWVPLTLWFWDRLLAERRARDAALFLLFYLLNLSGGCYLAYMIHFPLLAIFLSRAVAERRELFSLRMLRLMAPVALVAGMAGPCSSCPTCGFRRLKGSPGLRRRSRSTAPGWPATSARRAPTSTSERSRGRSWSASSAIRRSFSTGLRTACSRASCPRRSSWWEPPRRCGASGGGRWTPGRGGWPWRG